jgi:hypothetical protein
LIHDPPCDSYETKESKGKRVAAALVERKNFCPGVVLANYHFCGLIVESYRRLFPIYSPSRFFLVNLGSWAKSKTSELHTKLPEGTSFWPFGILKHMMATAMHYRVS